MELSLEAEPLLHTQLKTQNFQSINPSMIKPAQPPKVSIVSVSLETVIAPVLRVNDLDEVSLGILLSIFASPYFEEKYTGNVCSNKDMYRAWCTLYGSLDKEFSVAVANTGLVMADLRVTLVEYQTVNSFVVVYKALVPSMAQHLQGMEDDNIDDRNSLSVIMCVLCQTLGKYVITT